jgi:hypothetical protein
MRFRSFAKKLFVVLTAIMLSLLLLEFAIRIYQTTRAGVASTPPSESSAVRLHIETTEPYLYGLNPEHSDISSQGTRDDEVAIPKPKGTFRILVLGDSIPYGSRTARDATFANRLESILRQRLGKVEVVNAGVMGYTAYNELHYYLTRGREFEPDIVIVAFCMNDVVNPRIHWGDAPNVTIPDEAIPNLVYDRNHILPAMQKAKEARARASERTPLLERSELYKAVQPAVERLSKSLWLGPMGRVPTYITGEDSISITVLLERSSPESQWLTSIYDELDRTVRADGARLVVAIFPLAYQLDKGYPFFPQKMLAEFCTEKSIECLDLLPVFSRYPKESIFLLNKEVFHDVWHLTDYGHQVTADEFARFMTEKGLLQGAKRQD